MISSKELVYEYEISREYNEKSRWNISISSVCLYNNKYYLVNWQEGLTEYQENYFPDNPPVEVYPSKQLEIALKIWYTPEPPVRALPISQEDMDSAKLLNPHVKFPSTDIQQQLQYLSNLAKVFPDNPYIIAAIQLYTNLRDLEGDNNE